MIGKTISHYKILEKLGEGGMGEVYLAEDIKLKRKVALKFLPPHLTTNKEATKRFEQEAQAAAALNHPNIITIHEIGEYNNQTFIAMEYLEGKTLRKLIEEGLLKVDKSIDIACQICDGLAKAHQDNIAHRDIKPENIFIDSDGRVKILDFGLAKLKGISNLTQESSTLGTVKYMSPEQAQGEEIDRRTDIWSFGIVLYEMLSGQQPFKGEYEHAVIYSILNEPPKPLTSLKIDMPFDLERIVNKALAKSPDERYQHLDEIPVDLKSIEFDSIPVSLRSPSFTSKKKVHSINQLPVIKSTFRKPIFIGSLFMSIIVIMLIAYLIKTTKDNPVVVLMDTPIPLGVYDPITREQGGTNADDITDILRDLPIVVHKETTSPLWHREHQVLKQRPDLVIIHGSCFIDTTGINNSNREHIYTIAWDKVITFLAYIALGNQDTKFLIYSRSFTDETWRSRCLSDMLKRFPPLQGRLVALGIPGGHEKATFRDPDTAEMVKLKVISILNLK